VTGDRIGLDLHLNGCPMGGTAPADGRRVLDISVVAWDEIERLDVIKNGRIWRSLAEPCPAPKWDGGPFRFLIEWGWDRNGPHPWEGRLELHGGRLLQAIPCYRGSMRSRVGTGIETREDALCTWSSRTEKPEVWGFSRRSADILAVEADCPPDARLELTMTTGDYRRALTLSPQDIMARSRVAYMVDVPPTNDGFYWSRMDNYLKVKVHRGWPTETLSLDLSLEDEASGGGTDYYYVRVIQRNGQRAWSSPIWVRG
jgi:hypothetical protein